MKFFKAIVNKFRLRNERPSFVWKQGNFAIDDKGNVWKRESKSCGRSLASLLSIIDSYNFHPATVNIKHSNRFRGWREATRSERKHALDLAGDGCKALKVANNEQ